MEITSNGSTLICTCTLYMALSYFLNQYVSFSENSMIIEIKNPWLLKKSIHWIYYTGMKNWMNGEKPYW